MAITASGASIITFTDKLVKVFFEEAFLERQDLYAKYAHHTIQNTQDLQSCVSKIITLFC